MSSPEMLKRMPSFQAEPVKVTSPLRCTTVPLRRPVRSNVCLAGTVNLLMMILENRDGRKGSRQPGVGTG